jgi:hypothetical protein
LRSLGFFLPTPLGDDQRRLLDSAVLSRLDQLCRDAERALEGLEDAAVGIDAKVEETQCAITSIVTGPVASPSSEDANSRTSLGRRSTAHRWGSQPKDAAEHGGEAQFGDAVE